MADTTATVTVVETIHMTGSSVWVRGTIAFGASPLTYPAAGIPFGVAQFGAQAPPAAGPPEEVFAQGGGYGFVYDPALALLHVFSAAATELGAAAIPAALSTGPIRFVALFNKLV